MAGRLIDTDIGIGLQEDGGIDRRAGKSTRGAVFVSRGKGAWSSGKLDQFLVSDTEGKGSDLAIHYVGVDTSFPFKFQFKGAEVTSQEISWLLGYCSRVNGAGNGEESIAHLRVRETNLDDSSLSVTFDLRMAVVRNLSFSECLRDGGIIELSTEFLYGLLIIS